jgi:hypothetical protein
VETLGGSENAIKQSIFKPSGNAWRLGKCDKIIGEKHFAA